MSNTRVRCTKDGEFPESNEKVIFQCVSDGINRFFDNEKIYIGYFSNSLQKCFVSMDSYAYYPENYTIYWQPLTSLKEQYERERNGK